MVYFVVEGINDGGVKCVSRHLPPPFKETLKISKILWCKVIIRRTLAFFTAGEKLVQQIQHGTTLCPQADGACEVRLDCLLLAKIQLRLAQT